MHELLVLIDENPGPQQHRLFKETLNLLDAGTRKEWKTVASVAAQSSETSPLGKSLAAIRNSISSHYYQPKALGSGYKEFFSQNRAGAEEACLSRGVKLSQARFYFADAAAQCTYEAHMTSGGGQEIV